MPITPKISVCMAMYNAAPYLRECVDSILAQTFTDFELLIIDDGSTDNSVGIVESYNDPRIRLINQTLFSNCECDKPTSKKTSNGVVDSPSLSF